MNKFAKQSTICVLFLGVLFIFSGKINCNQVPFINVMVSVLPLNDSESSNSSLEYSIYLVYVDHDGSKKIRSTTKNIPGSEGTTTFAFPGDYVKSCSVTKVSGDGLVKVEIAEGSKTVFTSNRVELVNPIEYTKNEIDDNSYSSDSPKKSKPKLRQLPNGTWTY